MNVKIENVLTYLNQYAVEEYNKGKRKTRELFPSFDIISKNCNLKIIEVRQIITYLEENGHIIRHISQRYLKWVWDKLNNKAEATDNPIKTVEKTNKNTLHKVKIGILFPL